MISNSARRQLPDASLRITGVFASSVDVVVEPGAVEHVEVDVEFVVLQAGHLHWAEDPVAPASLEREAQRVQVGGTGFRQLGVGDFHAGEHVALVTVEPDGVFRVLEFLETLLLEPDVEPH